MATQVHLLEDEDFDFNFNRRLTKTQKKRLKRQLEQEKQKLINLREIEPKTTNQELAFDYYDDGFNLLLHGVAGTGKTFISLYLALDEVFNGDGDYTSITIIRSVVPTRDIGFLPGKETEKTAVYEQPYQGICTELTGRSDGYSLLKSRGVIEFLTTSFIRGTTIDNSIIIVDECQNMTFHELDSIITRVGENSKILFCGDFRQTDLNKPWDQSGIKDFIQILSSIKTFKPVEFDYEDIVRSGLVRDYIIAKDKFNEKTSNLLLSRG